MFIIMMTFACHGEEEEASYIVGGFSLLTLRKETFAQTFETNVGKAL